MLFKSFLLCLMLCELNLTNSVIYFRTHLHSRAFIIGGVDHKHIRIPGCQVVESKGTVTRTIHVSLEPSQVVIFLAKPVEDLDGGEIESTGVYVVPGDSDDTIL